MKPQEILVAERTESLMIQYCKTWRRVHDIKLYEDDKRETNVVPRIIKLNKIKGVLCVGGCSMNLGYGKEDGWV